MKMKRPAVVERLDHIARLILSQLEGVFEHTDQADFERLAKEVTQAKRIFVAGQGRTGLVAKAFAMRLAHLGLNAYVVGETMTPAIGADDLLMACSGSGASQVTLSQVRLASKAGAKVLGVTWDRESPLAKASDELVLLPVQEAAEQSQLKQFSGSLFEQALLVCFDALAAALQKESGISNHEMQRRHANLE